MVFRNYPLKSKEIINNFNIESKKHSLVLHNPCLTLTLNTERPITLRELGEASVLVRNNIKLIRDEYLKAMNKPCNPIRTELWDDHTAGL